MKRSDKKAKVKIPDSRLNAGKHKRLSGIFRNLQCCLNMFNKYLADTRIFTQTL